MIIIKTNQCYQNMSKYSRRKFVETALISGAGIKVVPDIIKDQEIIRESPAIETVKDEKLHDFNTMRPVRKMYPITVTVGQTSGDFVGNDDKILQAAVDYVTNLGGGTILIGPGIYTMRNSLFPRPRVKIIGSGESTILRKTATFSSKVIRESDWFEYCVQVENSEGFTVGGGIALNEDKKDAQKALFYTITAIDNNILFLDKLTGEDFWMEGGARASTRYSIIYALNVDDVCIENLVLDGNREENEYLNGNYGGAVFMQCCNRWTFKNVVERDFNGDGYSFQICDDIHFEDCSSLNNATLGFHPGSGSQRPVFKKCISKGNAQGFFWCWGVCDGIAEDCIASENRRFGVNFGHRDTDNIIRNCTIEKNGEIGVLFRKEPNEYRLGDRNIIDSCVIRDNGQTGTGIGVDIQWKTSDITIRNCLFENTINGSQKTGIRISPEAMRISLDKNTFKGIPVKIEDQRVACLLK